MAQDYTKLQTARAVVVLTALEVAATRFETNKSDHGGLSVEVAYTKGDETNCIVRFYASQNGTDYYPIAETYTGVSETLTASTTKIYSFPAILGYRFFRVSGVATAGTPTGTLGINYRYFVRGSQR
jgi:hypothetical protein